MGGQEMIKQVICLFHCVENALLPPLPKIFGIVHQKDKRHKGFLLFCFVFVEIKEKVQVPHLLWYQGKDGQTELPVRIKRWNKIVIQWRECIGVGGKVGTCRNVGQSVRLFIRQRVGVGANPPNSREWEIQGMPRIYRTWGSLGLT